MKTWVGAGVLLGLLLVAGCGPKARPVTHVGPDGYKETGVASWYGRKFHGRLTANGERYDMRAMTAAHRTLAFGTVVRVTNLENGRTVQVRINDRGPFKKGRIIDLSKGAAKKIGMIERGVVRVRVEAVR